MMAALPSLAERLRAGTQGLHREVERAGIMPALLRGQLDRPRYCALLRSLHAVYAALEPALLRHADRADLAPVCVPVLFRQQALAEDLTALHSPKWSEAWPLQPAAIDYVARLHTLADTRPELLAAHAYVRYLGDLSGGQMLRRIVAQSFGLRDGLGTRFYDFGDAAQVAAHLQVFRAGLAAIEGSESQQDALVAEARSAFERHRALFVELAGTA